MKYRKPYHSVLPCAYPPEKKQERVRIVWHDSPRASAGIPLVLSQSQENGPPAGYDRFLEELEKDEKNCDSPGHQCRVLAKIHAQLRTPPSRPARSPGNRDSPLASDDEDSCARNVEEPQPPGTPKRRRASLRFNPDGTPIPRMQPRVICMSDDEKEENDVAGTLDEDIDEFMKAATQIYLNLEIERKKKEEEDKKKEEEERKKKEEEERKRKEDAEREHVLEKRRRVQNVSFSERAKTMIITYRVPLPRHLTQDSGSSAARGVPTQTGTIPMTSSNQSARSGVSNPARILTNCDANVQSAKQNAALPKPQNVPQESRPSVTPMSTAVPRTSPSKSVPKTNRDIPGRPPTQQRKLIFIPRHDINPIKKPVVSKTSPTHKSISVQSKPSPKVEKPLSSSSAGAVVDDFDDDSFLDGFVFPTC